MALTMTREAFSDVTQTWQPATIMPTMQSDIDGWKLDGIADDDLLAIFKDYSENSIPEVTIQGLVNETDEERPQLAKLAREEMIDLYMWRVENGLDLYTGKDLGLQSKEDDDAE